MKDFEAYRAVKAMQRAGMDSIDEENTENGVGDVVPGIKRPRTESAQERREEEMALQSAAAAETSRCSIM